jgi:DNA phosphorothioation-dependent restriction protein DptH
VTVAAGDQATKRAFIWRFPQCHAYRTMVNLFDWFKQQAQGNPVPVFSIPFFEELMLAKDEEEVNRILQHALQEGYRPKVFNLLDAHNIDGTDKVVELMKKLAFEYTGFIVNARDAGICNALEGFPSLESAFRDAYGAFLSDPECVHSQVGPLLFKAFCVLGERQESGGSPWMWRDHEPCFLVSPLHPALMEMLYHQHAYLCESFVVAARQGLRETGPKWFNERRWADIEDLAQIQWPLHGTLRNQDHFLDTNVRSFGLMHLVGEPPERDAALTTRLLLRYDAEEDDAITDEDLFRVSRESRLVQRVLEDYRSLNPHADDGMAIAAYCSSDIQALISGVDGFLEGVFSERREDRPYTLSLTLFAESQDDTTISRWVREWRERWEAAEPSSKLSYYRGCRISVAHRMITREKDYAQFVTLLNNIDADVAFLFQFIRAGAAGNRFVQTEPYDHSGNYRMFPVLEKMCCSVMGGGHEFTRERIISNRQFKLGTLHSGVMAKLRHMADSHDSEYVVMGRGEFGPWSRVVDQLHKRSAWVVCVDPAVDEHLITKEDANGKRSREIIGFGSGVGAHGEYNYTVSTEEYSLASVKKKVRAHVAAKLGPWDVETCDQIAESVTKEVTHMAGKSLVRAIGPAEYVRDFIAYAVVRKLLPRKPGVFCDELISLDAYRHWFDSAPTGKRPDLLHLKAKIEDGLFKISAQLIECKLAQQSERHLEKAREQLECGLSHLIACFRPRQADVPEGLDDRPDQRYWWLQLHRLLASKGRVSPPELSTTVGALERMSDGLFSIRWTAAAVTFWTDSDRGEIWKEGEWRFNYEGSSMPIPIISAGRHFIRDLCTKGMQPELPTDVIRVISLSSVSKSRTVEKEYEDEAQNFIGSTEDTSPQVDDVSKEESQLEPVITKVDESGSRRTIKPASVPTRIFLGNGVHANMELYWEFGHKELANRHMLIFGTSGMGKTYTIQALLCELGRHGQNSLIVDYTDGFHENQLERETIDVLKPTQHIVKLSKVPINPFRRQQESLGGQLLPEDPANTAQRVTGVFSEVYQLGDQQWSAIYSAVKLGVDRYGDEMSLVHLPQLLLDGAKDGTIVAAAATSAVAKIQPFVDMNPFGQEDPESWEKLFADTTSRCHILQLAGYLKEAAKLITEFSLIDFYWYYRTRGNKNRPRVIVLDEIQNLDQRLESPLGKFVTEGRKFGICLIMATQTLGNFEKDELGRLFQAAHKLFFRPAEIELKNYAQILANTTNEKIDEWVHRLSSLQKGECYSLGPALNQATGNIETKAFKIRIASLSSRFNG